MAEGLLSFKRLFYWGPLIAIGIIKCVTFVTLYMNAMWWPPNQSLFGFLHQTIFLFLSGVTAFNFLMAALWGPRYLPLGWKPKIKADEKFLQFCTVCEGYKAPRSHHCRKCGRCVLKMDHHCPWINNCVGWGNHAYFTSFLTFAVIGCVQATIILSCSLYRGIHRHWYIYYGKYELATVHLGLWSLLLCIFSLGLAIGVVIAVGMLLFFQIRTIIRNRTQIEDWILEKAKCRLDGTDEEFIYPYDLGIKKNITQLSTWTCEPIGDGITWEVREGCDQYTLTREQIKQKSEKRARTKAYTIIKNVTGSWIPFWSQGFKVTVHPPCTDEPRLKLVKGDVVNVTRWRRYWLFGERCEQNKNTSEKSKHKVRGWFPRQCAVELYENNSESKEHFDNLLNKKSN